MNIKQKILVEHLLRRQIEAGLRGTENLQISLQGHYSVPKISITIPGESNVGILFNVDEEISVDENYDRNGEIDIEEARNLIIKLLAET